MPCSHSTMSISRIQDDLYVGGLGEALTYSMLAARQPVPFNTIIDVLETPGLNTMLIAQIAQNKIKYIHYHILEPDGGILTAPHERLDGLVDLIDKNKPCIISCAAGIERSPLAVAWYLSKKGNVDLDMAYKVVETLHPQTQNRQFWIK